jgi:hypothetical protein
VPKSALEIELSIKAGTVQFKFVDAGEKTVSISNKKISKIDPTHLRLICYFKARDEVKQPFDPEKLVVEEEEEKQPKAIEILDVQAL